MSDKPKLEKYDRFEWGDEEIEYTGFKPFIDEEENCLCVGINSGGEAKALFFTEATLQSSEFKKLPPLPVHRVFLEAARLIKENPELQAQFDKAMPCQDLCGQCRECSKRIGRTDNA